MAPGGGGHLARIFPDGKTRWFKISGMPFFGADGSLQGYRGIGADITAHVEADQAARLAQSRLHDAVAHVTQPFVFYDAHHRATAFNQAFTDLHRNPGHNSPVAQGVSFRELAEWQVRYGFYAADGHGRLPVREIWQQARPGHALRYLCCRFLSPRRTPPFPRPSLWPDDRQTVPARDCRARCPSS
jgi:PAS domain-containing protein